MFLENDALDQEWFSKGKCKGVPTADFFPVRDISTYATIAKASKDICKGKDGRPPCPVRKQCLLWALIGNGGEGEAHGIWGGYSHRERNVLERKAASANLSIEEYVNLLP